MEMIPQALVDEVRRGTASLFLGAGASREAGFPDSWELADYLTTRAGAPHADRLRGQPLDVVAQHLYMEAGYGKQWVRQAIIEHFAEKHRQTWPSAERGP